MNYLFQFVIGPVQTYISDARKMRDLYAGSYILSSLTDYAIANLPKNSEIIFPNQNIKSKPNMFLSIIDTQDIKSVGDNIKAKVIEKFIENHLKELPDEYNEQVDKFLDIKWGALPLKDDYYQTFITLQKYMASLKNARIFEQFSEHETGRKCSICGERNVVFYNPIVDKKGEKRIQAYVSNYVEKSSMRNLLNLGEGLCAVCYFKRNYEVGENFPSVAEIAMKYIIGELESKNSESAPLIKDYKNLFGKDFDFQLFYPENLNENYFTKNGLNDKKHLLKKAKEVQGQVKKYVSDKGLTFRKYYAIVLFDGDDMGKWLSGDFLNDKSKLKEFQTYFSEELGNFASKCRNIFDARDVGKSIYAGGDDFLGFICLDKLSEAMSEIRHSYDNIDISKYTSKKPTFSAGIAIAHYKTPLSDVLKTARNSEKIAKTRFDNKDSFCITILKHSGEINQTCLEWKNKDTNNIEFINRVVEFLRDEKGFSSSFIDNLQMEFVVFQKMERRIYDRKSNLDKNVISDVIDLMKAEFSRLINRAKKEKSSSEQNNKNASTLNNILTNLLYNSMKIDNFFHALNIAKFIYREDKHEN
jgi:CRISPR-associated protein Cmr2